MSDSLVPFKPFFNQVEDIVVFYLKKCLILKTSSIFLKQECARLLREKQQMKIINFKRENDGYLIPS